MDYGERYTDKKISAVDRELKQTYRTAQSELKEKLAEFMKKHAVKNREKRRQLDAGQITEQEYRDWLTGQIFTRNKWQQQIKMINAVLLDHNRQALNIVQNSRLDVFAENYNFNAWRAERETGFSFNIYSSESVARLIEGDPQLLPEWEIDKEKDYTWNQRRVNNILKQGILQGEDMEKIMQRLCIGLATSNEKKMRMFARTAMNGAQNAGRQKQMENAAKMGIEVAKRWVAVHDSRTRDAHRDLDGTEVPYDKPFKSLLGEIMFPGDPTAEPGNVYNCRCRTVTIYPKYEDRSKKYGEGEVIEGKPYEEWKIEKRKKNEVEGETSISDEEFTRAYKNVEKMISENKGNWSPDQLIRVGEELTKVINHDLPAVMAEKKEELDRKVEEQKRIRNENFNESSRKSDELLKATEDGDKKKISELKKSIKENDRLASEAQEKIMEMEKKYSALELDSMFSILSQFREFGGITQENLFAYKEHFADDVLLTKNKGLVAKSMESLNYYPTEWLNASKSAGIIFPKYSSARAHYSSQVGYDYGAGGVKTRRKDGIILTDGSTEVTVHESAHRFEHIYAPLKEAEKSFYEKRTKDEPLQSLRDVTGFSSYREDEVTRVDKFVDPYIGKQYPNGNYYEITSMGMQYLTTNISLLRQDAEMYQWLLGVLVGV